MAIIIAVLIILRLQPLTKHLAIQHDKSALKHLLHTVAKRDYRIGFYGNSFFIYWWFYDDALWQRFRYKQPAHYKPATTCHLCGFRHCYI